MWFHLDINDGTLFVEDGAAYVERSNGQRQDVCEADASCSAFQIDDESEVKGYEAAACEALGANCPTIAGGRRLKSGGCDATSAREHRRLKEEAVAARSVVKGGRLLSAKTDYALKMTFPVPRAWRLP